MRRRSNYRSPWLVVYLVLGASALGWLVNTQGPSPGLIAVFLGLLFAVAFILSLLLFNNVRRAALFGVGVVTFFILRLIGLRETYYVVLLIVTLVLIDILFSRLPSS